MIIAFDARSMDLWPGDYVVGPEGQRLRVYCVCDSALVCGFDENGTTRWKTVKAKKWNGEWTIIRNRGSTATIPSTVSEPLPVKRVSDANPLPTDWLSNAPF